MKKILILIIVFFIYSNHLNTFKITFPLPGMLTNTCRIEGTAEPNETIRVFIGKEEKRKEMQEIERVVADKNGKWSCCPKFPIIDYEFKKTITVYNSKDQELEQEISIKLTPLSLTFVNHSNKKMTISIDELAIKIDETQSEINLKFNYLDGQFYIYFYQYIDLHFKEIKIRISEKTTMFLLSDYDLNKTIAEKRLTMNQIMEPYLKHQLYIKDYNANKKNKLIQNLNNTIPIELINIMDDYVYFDENDFETKIETIKYHVILDDKSKIKLLSEDEYNKSIKQ